MIGSGEWGERFFRHVALPSSNDLFVSVGVPVTTTAADTVMMRPVIQ